MNLRYVDSSALLIGKTEPPISLMMRTNETIVRTTCEPPAIITNVRELRNHNLQVFQLSQHMTVFKEYVGRVALPNNTNNLGEQTGRRVFKTCSLTSSAETSAGPTCGYNVDNAFVFTGIKFGDVSMNRFVLMFQKLRCFSFIFDKGMWCNITTKTVSNTSYTGE
ncbi:hypothetical protein FR483_n750R [Paramecium bursaria Chlorella virus FR483]|uniref:Uncharacterized protein n750R n=1 Tax=Paramecium bursaria Chlorella virus FR483 TaxID=399781 RepID=A7J8A4_PBCVF|nr:hypothetical protein FR483_n750R [Paramecium bursaria Chlorella virus FR483]ABT16035.1 hypothetical protein FR483_n750R [Paramecium bursaria Chlorella virus FR483]